MEEWLQLRVQGKITPVRPLHKFSVSDIEAAFRYMSTGTHIGKIVITTEPKGSADELVKVERSMPIPADSIRRGITNILFTRCDRLVTAHYHWNLTHRFLTC